MKIVLASSNAGKLREFQAALSMFHSELLPQSQFNFSEAEENALTFIENALLKARHAALHTGLSALADDSGLVVEALNGKPGIHSARYAGSPSNAKANINKLLEVLQFETNRRAHFHCSIVFLHHAEDPDPVICQGIWQGEIVKEPRGTHGFGYDPIFYIPSEKKTAAELTLERKNQISHRGLAIKSLIQKM